MPPFRPAGRDGAPHAAEPWLSGEWRRFDWDSAAALAPNDREQAARAWSDLDWDEGVRSRDRARNDLVASALERIAQQIRAGELPVRGQTGMTEEAAVAAALAALLAQRR